MQERRLVVAGWGGNGLGINVEFIACFIFPLPFSLIFIEVLIFLRRERLTSNNLLYSSYLLYNLHVQSKWGLILWKMGWKLFLFCHCNCIEGVLRSYQISIVILHLGMGTRPIRFGCMVTQNLTWMKLAKPDTWFVSWWV